MRTYVRQAMHAARPQDQSWVASKEEGMARGKLSDRQSRMVEFIHNFSRDNGYPPSIREIGEAVGISSTSVVNYNLNRLVVEGYLDRDQNVSRGIRLKEKFDRGDRSSVGGHPHTTRRPHLCQRAGAAA